MATKKGGKKVERRAVNPGTESLELKRLIHVSACGDKAGTKADTPRQGEALLMR